MIVTGKGYFVTTHGSETALIMLERHDLLEFGISFMCIEFLD